MFKRIIVHYFQLTFLNSDYVMGILYFVGQQKCPEVIQPT